MDNKLEEALKALFYYYYTEAEEDGGFDLEVLDKLMGKAENEYVMQKIKDGGLK